MFHPASLLLLWGAGVVCLQQLALRGTLIAAAAALLAARLVNATLLSRLLFRSRWLFLTMILLFLWLTPGVRLPEPWGGMGMTQDGLVFAAEHVGRLATMLALLVLLLSRLDHRAIVSGLYLLSAPLGRFVGLRRSLAVRLMLTLEEVAEKNGHEWKSLLKMSNLDDATGLSELRLLMPSWTWRDGALAVAAVCMALAVWWAP